MIDVVAAVICRDGKILITQRKNNVHLAGLWEFPGGKVETNESLKPALQREIREEIGIDIDVGDELVTTEHHYATRSVRLHFFACTIVSGEPEAIEVAGFKWISPSEFDSYKFPEADLEIINYLRKP